MPLSIEEKTIIKMYSAATPDRNHTLHSIRGSLSLAENDKEIYALMESVIRKVTAMSDADFESLDLSDSLDTFEP